MKLWSVLALSFLFVIELRQIRGKAVEILQSAHSEDKPALNILVEMKPDSDDDLTRVARVPSPRRPPRLKNQTTPRPEPGCYAGRVNCTKEPKRCCRGFLCLPYKGKHKTCQPKLWGVHVNATTTSIPSTTPEHDYYGDYVYDEYYYE